MRIVLTGLERMEILPAETLSDPIDPGVVFVRVLSCAVCRTDAKMWHQGHRDLILPRVPGHEIVVADDNDRKFTVWPGNSCGCCHFCQTGRENLCDKMRITGFHLDGGFADQMFVSKENMIPIPKNLDTHVACFAEPVGCVVNAFEQLSPNHRGQILIYGGGTMGLIAALYARHLGYVPLIIEKDEVKINHITPFLSATRLTCAKETRRSAFDTVINACADYIAFCQSISKVRKGGQIAFFSGLTKNEKIETNLLNGLHYKEVHLVGAYGLTRDHMSQAIPFLMKYEGAFEKLIEAVISPRTVPQIMPKVLSEKHLKYVLDFNFADLKSRMAVNRPVQKPSEKRKTTIWPKGICHDVISSITPLSDNLLAEATAKMDSKTKPLGALGRLETLSVKMCRIQNCLSPEILQKQLFVFAGDHGVTEEGVSAYPSEVTAQMVENFLTGGAAINVLCRHHRINLKVVDMGVARDFVPHQDLVDKKVAYGTRNLAVRAAMTNGQAILAVENGMTTFLEAHLHNPLDIVGLGEMGIGNTTSAAAIISAITGISPALATGRGTGVDDKGLAHKTEVIERALAFHQVNKTNGFDVLKKIGGFEIAGIVGAVLAAASVKTAVVLDGVISTAAGLIAHTIHSGVADYLISGHKSVEPSHEAALSHMGLVPLIDFDMRLGEGTGAALAINVAEAACKIMCQMTSFDEAKVAKSSIK